MTENDSPASVRRSGMIWTNPFLQQPGDIHLHPMYSGSGYDARVYRPMWHVKQGFQKTFDAMVGDDDGELATDGGRDASGTKHVPRLKFAEEHIEPILAGHKTATLRLDLDGSDFRIGDRFKLCDEDGERFASAHVSDRGYTSVGMAGRMQIDGHRNYRSVDELLEELRGYYPEMDVDENTTVEIVYWEEVWQ